MSEFAIVIIIAGAVLLWLLSQTRERPQPRTAKRERSGTGHVVDRTGPRNVRAILSLTYTDAEGQTTLRTVRVESFDATRYGGSFVGHCELRGDSRTFRIDRVQSAVDTSTGEEIHDLRAYLSRLSGLTQRIGSGPIDDDLNDLLRTTVSLDRHPRPDRHRAQERPEESAKLADRCWTPAGRIITVGGYRIEQGMLYIGKDLPPVGGWHPAEPALIDPSLPVARHSPAREGGGMPYWPSYGSIPAECRAAYLEWLSTGRSDPHAYIGYVFLYFYGLERRLLFDLRHLPDRQGEASALIDEVDRLLSIYGENRSFRQYGSALLHLARALWSEAGGLNHPPSTERRGGEIPIEVRLAVGRLIAAGKPIPAEWALAWVAGHPETRLRTPSQRCAKEFRELFLHRFNVMFGEGMVLKPNKRRLRISHKPASASFGGPVDIHFDLPDITGISAPLRLLRELAETASSELESYSRFIGRNPGEADSLQALALLPPELAASRESPETLRLREWFEQTLSGRDWVVTTVSHLIALWQCERDDRIRKDELGSLARMLDSIGYGIEPDPRFGGSALSADQKIVLFRVESRSLSAVSPTYHAATLLLHLAAAVAASDGEISEEEERHLEGHLERSMDLTQTEVIRLRAHLQWLVASPPKLTRLKRRVEEIDERSRHQIAHFAVAIAGADGVIDPEEVKILTKIYQLLGLDPDQAYGDIHSLRTDSRWHPADQPVTVRPPESHPIGYAIPGHHDRTPASGSGFQLDMERIERTLAETAVVSSVLAEVFVDDAALEPVSSGAPQDATTTADLDAPHSQLLLALKARAEISREDFEKLAEELNLLPDGAFEALNEAAFERAGLPLLEGEDPIEIDLETLGVLTE